MSDFKIRYLAVGEIGTNCYILYRKGQKKAVIVDPGDEGLLIMSKCRELGVEPEAVLLTHGHFDHMMALGDLRRAFPELVVYGGEEEEELLEDPKLNLSAAFGKSVSEKADQLVKDGDELEFGQESWKVIHTPGHTHGSVSYYNQQEGILLSGDTLFAGSLGRTDFPTGSVEEIVVSIVEKLFALPEDTAVYSGHGAATSIGYEKQHNPVRSYRRL